MRWDEHVLQVGTSLQRKGSLVGLQGWPRGSPGSVPGDAAPPNGAGHLKRPALRQLWAAAEAASTPAPSAEWTR